MAVGYTILHSSVQQKEKWMLAWRTPSKKAKKQGAAWL